MKFLKRSDLFYKSISNEIPVDTNVTNFAYADRTRVYGGSSGDEIYGTVSRNYPLSIVPEFAIDTSSITDWSKDAILTSIITGTSTIPDTWFYSVDNVLLARTEANSALAGRYHGPASTLDDATFASSFNYTSDTYDVVVECVTAAGTDQVRFSIDGGENYGSATNITGGAQIITGTGGDVTVTFGATTGHTQNARWHFKMETATVEVMSFPTAIQDFYVLDADPTLIAVRDERHLYMFPLDFDGRDTPDDIETLYNSFNISRFSRISLEEFPITNYKVIDDSGTLKVFFETKNIHQDISFERDIHFKITPTESNMDLNPLRHGAGSGYLYLDNSLETNVAAELNVKMDPRYRTSSEGVKYIWAKLTDERGVPMSGVNINTRVFRDEGAGGTLIEGSWLGHSGTIVHAGLGTDPGVTAAGTITTTTAIDIVLKIDGTGAPNTFAISTDGGASFSTAGVSITGSAQSISSGGGSTVDFTTTSGFTLNDTFSYKVFAQAEDHVTVNSSGIVATDAQGIAEFEVTYVKTAALIQWIEVEFYTGTLVKRVILSRDYLATQVL